MRKMILLSMFMFCSSSFAFDLNIVLTPTAAECKAMETEVEESLASTGGVPSLTEEAKRERDKIISEIRTRKEDKAKQNNRNHDIKLQFYIERGYTAQQTVEAWIKYVRHRECALRDLRHEIK